MQMQCQTAINDVCSLTGFVWVLGGRPCMSSQTELFMLLPFFLFFFSFFLSFFLSFFRSFFLSWWHDRRIEQQVIIVTQKPNGTVTTLAEFMAPEGFKSSYVDRWFGQILKVLKMLRMVRLRVGVPLPIPQLECHGWLSKKALSKSGAARRRFFVGHLNTLSYFVDEKAFSPTRVLEITPDVTISITVRELRECQLCHS